MTESWDKAGGRVPEREKRSGGRGSDGAAPRAVGAGRQKRVLVEFRVGLVDVRARQVVAGGAVGRAEGDVHLRMCVWAMGAGAGVGLDAPGPRRPLFSPLFNGVYIGPARICPIVQ